MLTAIRTALRFGIGSLRLQLQSKPKPPAILDFEYAKNGLDKYLKLQLYKFSIPAGSYALIHQNKLVAHNNIGFFRPRVRLPDPAKQKFNEGKLNFEIGSITKLFTATAIMQLVEKGLIDLDKPITTYIPLKIKDINNSLPSITVRDLLTHQSPLPANIANGMWGDDGTTLNSVLESVQDEHLRIAPKSFSYSNLGFSLLGLIVQHVSKQKYESYIIDNILHPLGMFDTEFLPNNVEEILQKWNESIAPGYRNEYKARTANCSILRDSPAGGIVSNIKDMAKFASFAVTQMGETPKEKWVLSGNSMKEMIKKQTLDEKTVIGLSWFMKGMEVGNENVYWHTGGTLGQRAILAVMPKYELAFVLLTNAESASSVIVDTVKKGLSLGKAVVESQNALKKKDRKESEKPTTKEVAPPKKIVVAELTPEIINDCVGSYGDTMLGHARVVYNENKKKLLVEARNQRLELVPKRYEGESSTFFQTRMLLHGIPIPIPYLSESIIQRKNNHGVEVFEVTHPLLNLAFEKLDSKKSEKFLPAWSNRVGSYKILNLKGLPVIGNFEIDITKENALVLRVREVLITEKSTELLLEPLSETKARMVGIGIDGGLIFEAREDGTLFAFGYHLQKIEKQK